MTSHLQRGDDSWFRGGVYREVMISHLEGGNDLSFRARG